MVHTNTIVYATRNVVNYNVEGNAQMFQTRVKMNRLGEFIAEEMRRRNMSARQFAEYVGVVHTTITKAMYQPPPKRR